MGFLNGTQKGGAYSALINTADTTINTGTFGNRVLSIGARVVAGTPSLATTGDLAAMLLYDRAHTAAQRTVVESYLATRYNITAYTAPTATIVFEGDSLTEGALVYDQNYPQQTVNAVATTVVDWANTGVEGQTLADMISDATQVTGRSTPSMSKNVCVLWGGTNDVSAPGSYASAATALTRFYGYADTLRAAGFSVVGIDMLPRSDPGGVSGIGQPAWNAVRAAFNADVATNWASHFDAMCFASGVSGLGADGDSDSTANYNADKVHLNQTGYGLIKNLVVAKLAALGIA